MAKAAMPDASPPGPDARAGAEPRKLFVKSYGCQMNVYDGQRMADIMSGEGYTETTAVEDADLIVMNTCHIRERAVQKVYSELGKLRELKTERARLGKETRVVVAGCVAQAEGAEIQRRQPAVDLVVGPQAYHRLPALMRQVDRFTIGPARILDTEFPAEDKFGHLPPPRRETTIARGVSAFVTVQEGCDKFCAFCVVPYTRGAEFSRPVTQILAEVERLAEAGVRDITLIGQNVNAYHGEGPDGRVWRLARLMRKVAEIPGVLRIRYSTSHPSDMDDDLIAAHGDTPAVMPYLHLPVQSGSDAILKAMNRRHGIALYHRLIDKIRAVRPDIALSSDFIVGFPGESDKDFADTLRLVHEIGFTSAYSFAYSARPGTPAATHASPVEAHVVRARLHHLQALLEEQRQNAHRAMVGRKLDVLVERKGRYAGQLVGKTPYAHTVQFGAPLEPGTDSVTNRADMTVQNRATDARIGDIVSLTIMRASTNSLFGE